VPLLEVFIATFFDSVTTLARGGLLRQYQPRHEDLAVVRGRIDLSRQFGANANRPDRLTCHYDDLTADNPWNRVLKKALSCTRAWIRRADLHRRWAELMGVLDDVDDSGLALGELDRLPFTRQAERYRDAVDWARWIIAFLAPSLRAGVDEAPALLFDMNKLFESAVAAEFRQRVRWTPEISVDVQDNSHFLGTLVDGERVEPAFRLKPDLILRHGAEVLRIADTKWKRVRLGGRRHLVPDEEDVYQMLAYAAAFGCHDLQLIYPWHPGLASASPAEIRLAPLHGRAPILRVSCVDVYDDELPLRIGDWL
jgi:5-methylcytosine-specific restriction enzyme subunit McrC